MGTGKASSEVAPADEPGEVKAGRDVILRGVCLPVEHVNMASGKKREETKSKTMHLRKTKVWPVCDRSSV